MFIVNNVEKSPCSRQSSYLIPVGNLPSAITYNGERLVVVNSNDNSLSIISRSKENGDFYHKSTSYINTFDDKFENEHEVVYVHYLSFLNTTKKSKLFGNKAQIVSGDLDGDGIHELAVISRESSSVHILRFDGEDNFRFLNTISTSDEPTASIGFLKTYDKNMLVITSGIGDAETSFYTARSDNAVYIENSKKGLRFPYKSVIADIDGDGSNDIITITRENIICSVNDKIEQITKRPDVLINSPGYPSSLLATDVNKDGLIDIIVSYKSTKSSDGCAIEGGGVAFFFNQNFSFHNPEIFCTQNYNTLDSIIVDGNAVIFTDKEFITYNINTSALQYTVIERSEEYINLHAPVDIKVFMQYDGLYMATVHDAYDSVYIERIKLDNHKLDIAICAEMPQIIEHTTHLEKNEETDNEISEYTTVNDLNNDYHIVHASSAEMLSACNIAVMTSIALFYYI